MTEERNLAIGNHTSHELAKRGAEGDGAQMETAWCGI